MILGEIEVVTILLPAAVGALIAFVGGTIDRFVVRRHEREQWERADRRAAYSRFLAALSRTGDSRIELKSAKARAAKRSTAVEDAEARVEAAAPGGDKRVILHSTEELTGACKAEAEALSGVVDAWETFTTSSAALSLAMFEVMIAASIEVQELAHGAALAAVDPDTDWDGKSIRVLLESMRKDLGYKD